MKKIKQKKQKTKSKTIRKSTKSKKKKITKKTKKTVKKKVVRKKNVGTGLVPVRKKRPAKKKKISRKPRPRLMALFPKRVIAAESAKYYTGVEQQAPVLGPQEFQFPGGYGDNFITLLVRDPHWVFAYWEVHDNKANILRVYNTDSWEYFDISLFCDAMSWYFNVRPNTSYCVDIGYITGDGKFVACARSNVVRTPRAGVSDEIDEKWSMPYWEWEKLFKMSGLEFIREEGGSAFRLKRVAGGSEGLRK
ncbi:MAG: DUF4912 domain-containing protein [Candidatus Margulisbacteria bacterium]|nr:DUF4912 domain-containing protein [Candidatus Margulisiibacteriota bacterium]